MRRAGTWGAVAACLALAAVPAGAGAQDPAGQPLTLPEAVARALAAHPSVAAADAAVEGASAELRRARSARAPSLTSELGATRFEEPMVVAPLHGFDPQSPPRFDRTLVQGALSVGYTLYEGGARGARIRRAAALENAAGAGLEAARQALAAETSRAYLAVVTAREVLGSAEARLAAVRAESARAAQLLEQGRAARVAVLRADAAASRAVADSVAAAWDADLAARSLARLMGTDPAALEAARLSTPRTPAPPPARDAHLAAALAASPAVVQARERLAAAAAAGDVAGSAWRPRVQVVGRLSEYASGGGHEQMEWQGGVQLSWPVFTGGARPAQVAAAAAAERAAAAELRLAELRVADAVDRALAAYASATARVAALEAAVAQSAEVARIERLALDEGAGVQTDYLAAEAELFAARTRLAEARAAVVDARVELARAAGRLDSDWIAENLVP